MPVDAFFGDADVPMGRSEVMFAKRICQACPVLMECAVFSLAGYEHGPDRYGIYAGSTPTERFKALKEGRGDITRSARIIVKQVLYMDSETKDSEKIA